MIHDANFWQNLVSRFAEQNTRIAQADVNSIWEYAGPEPGASESELLEAENSLGFEIPSEYREFLAVSNGWRGFYQDVSLLGVDLIVSSEELTRAWELVDSAGEGSGGLLQISRKAFLPVAVSKSDIDVFLIDTGERSDVRWIAGQEIERFNSFADFFAGMLAYNGKALNDLLRDPWLGSDGA
ncbi:SMI1/KNR4 family protein [Promicromonospora sukumoe]|uniref:SMI1/KNR4 family protein n=1 Tax=Promicromonospora sukumoe TaxID=88382 RepID=UPI0037CA9D12